MKYFIDFEAQQYTNEIIEIGCVREDGCQFHSLVHPGEKHKRLSGFVKKLTGITQEELNNAPSVDEVFTRFFYWLGQDGGPAQFYCYGTSDPDFVHASIKLATQLMPQAALSLIVSNMKDYSLTVKNHFGLISTPALIKVARYFENNDNLDELIALFADGFAFLFKYKSKIGLMLSFIIFSFSTIGPVVPLFIFPNIYAEQLASVGKDASYISSAFADISQNTFYILIIGILIAALVGGLFGQTMMKKHFEKAGII